MQYNDNTVERNLFYQAVHAVLEVELDEELALSDYLHSFERMFGKATMADVVGLVHGTVRFHGLFKTDINLTGIDRHLRLLESYQKLHTARSNHFKKA